MQFKLQFWKEISCRKGINPKIAAINVYTLSYLGFSPIMADGHYKLGAVGVE